MPIIKTSFVDAQTLAITFEVGTKTSTGKIVNYVAKAGDDTSGNVLTRDGKQIGFLIGEKHDKVHTFDTFTEDKAVDFFKLVNGIPQVGLEENYRITIGGVTFTPDQIFHKASILESARTSDAWPPEFVERHTIHIKLNAPLAKGDSIHVDFLTSLLKDINVTYQPEKMHSDAVHVTQTGFDPQDPLKVAFLSTWKGVDFGTDPATTLGNTPYKVGTGFHVVDSATGKTVFNGKVALSQGLDNPNNFWQNFNKTDVYKMDFSSVTKAGTYHIYVDGVGTSYDFTIGENVWQKVFETSAHGMYEQRSGIAHTAEFTDWVRPRRPPRSWIPTWALTCRTRFPSRHLPKGQPKPPSKPGVAGMMRPTGIAAFSTPMPSTTS
jgi:endoglucanase